MWQIIFLLLLSRLSPCPWPTAFWLSYVFVYLFACILSEVCWASWMSSLLFFSKFAECSDITSLNTFFLLFSFPALSCIPVTHVCLHLMVPHFSKALFIFLHSFFFWFFGLRNLCDSVSCSLLLQLMSSVESIWWNFYFSYCNLQVHNFCCVFSNFYSSVTLDATF